jgi:hypothetical protein
VSVAVKTCRYRGDKNDSLALAIGKLTVMRGVRRSGEVMAARFELR